jgi:hypothetical protein
VSIVLGAVLTFAIYSLLRLLDFTALSGWREIRSLGDQMGHFLRSDYGTFKLRSGSGETWNILLYVRMLVHESVTANPLALAGLVLAPPFIAWRKVKEGALAGQEKAFFLLTVSVWIYMAVFFTLSNNEETAFTETVLERFLLFPALAGTIMSGYILAWAWHLFSDALRVLLPVLALALAALNASNNFNALNFRTNTAVEDNAIGILNLLPFDKPVVVLANGDTVYNSLVYAQEVLGVRRDAVVLPIGRLFDRDLLSRAQKKVNLIVDKSVFKQDVKGVARDLIRPNISAVNFFMTEPAVWKDIRTVYRPLGALLTAGSGVVVDTTGENLVPNRSSISQMAAINGYNETQSIYSRRCMVNLMEAKLAENNSDAAKALDKALDKVPFCLPAIHHKCARIPSGGSRRECDEMLEKAMASYHNYW